MDNNVFTFYKVEDIIFNYIEVPYRWQHIKILHKQNAQCLGNTKNCLKTN